MILAGMEAQRKYRPSSVRHYHASSGYHHIVDVISYFVQEEQELNAYLKLLGLRARNFVAKPEVWTGIEATSIALVKRTTLSAKDVEQVLSTLIASSEKSKR